ncbi:hypothetical protein ACFYL4_13110, partial [Nocardiopsis sp. NPDC006938]
NGPGGQPGHGAPGGSGANPPLWGGQDDTAGYGQPGQSTLPDAGRHAGQPSPFGQGPAVPPVPGGPVGGQGSGQPGFPGAPGGPGYPTGAYPADQLRGDLPTAFPGHTTPGDPYGQRPRPGGYGAPGDPLQGGFSPQRPEPDYGYPPVDGWQPQPPEVGDGRGGPGQQPDPGPYGQPPYGHPAPGQEHYEGGYEDGRFR